MHELACLSPISKPCLALMQEEVAWCCLTLMCHAWLTLHGRSYPWEGMDNGKLEGKVGSTGGGMGRRTVVGM